MATKETVPPLSTPTKKKTKKKKHKKEKELREHESAKEHGHHEIEKTNDSTPRKSRKGKTRNNQIEDGIQEAVRTDDMHNGDNNFPINEESRETRNERDHGETEQQHEQLVEERIIKDNTHEDKNESSEEKNEGVTDSPELKLEDIPTERINIINLVTPLEKRFSCSQCEKPLIYPLILEECKHKICSSCFHETMRKDDQSCLTCNSTFELSKVTLDKKLQKKVMKLKVKCNGMEFGCEWKGTVKHLDEHHSVCEKVGVYCTNGCGVIIERVNLDNHVANKCIEGFLVCEYCQEQMKRRYEEEHYKKCPKIELTCPNNCSEEIIPREDMDFHLEEECPKTKVFCPFQNIGCKMKIRRVRLQRHLKQGIIEHTRLIYDMLMTQDQVMQQHHKLLTDHGALLENHEEQLMELHTSSKSHLIWKIEDVTRKYAEAKAGTNTILYSSPFATSKYGYRLRATICLYGDGKAKGTHVSVFVHILKGHYDEILCWPFQHQITFHLLHQHQQRNLRKHVKFVIKPNGTAENEPFLGRPKSERNSSFGAVRFVKKEYIKNADYGYVKNDVIFIKISVECDASAEA